MISGRVKSHLHGDPEHETSERTPAQGIADGVEAERLGFARVWLAERPELKEPATILGGIAARTSSIGIGTGIVAIAAATLPLRVPGLRAFALAVWVLAAALLVVFTGALFSSSR